MSTRLQYEQSIVEILAQRDDATSMLSVPLATTAAGTTTTVRSTQLGRGTKHANRYDGRIIKWVEDPTTTGPAVGEITGVDDAGFDATDQLTVSPALSAAPETAKDFILYPEGWGPEPVVQAINEVLRNTESKVTTPVTLCEDGDMEDTAVARWTQLGTPTTFQKETDSGVFSLFGGRQGIEVVADAADEGFASANILVDEGRPFYVAALIHASDIGANVILYNVDAAAAIKTVTITARKLVLVWFQETAATDQRRASIRVTAAGAGTIRAGFIWAWDQRFQYEMSTISALWDAHMPILGIERLTRRVKAEDNDTYIPGELRRESFLDARKISQPTAVRQTVLELPQVSTDPLLVTAMRPFIELTTDTATSSADREYVVYKALANLLKARGEGEWVIWARRASRRAREVGYGGRMVSIEAPQTAMS